MSDNHGHDADRLDLPAGMFRSGANRRRATVRMYRRLGPQNVDVDWTDVEGQAVYEGDIVLGTVEEMKNQALGIVIAGEQFRWPDGRVPYVTVPEVNGLVQQAIAHYRQRTPFRFEARRPEDQDYVSFERQNGCWSQVGRRGNKQVISLGVRCTVGSAIHEIGHTLGLWHEQSRADRDQHIKVLWDNIQDVHAHNFNKHVQDGTDVGPYDFGSIMHYPATAFSKNGQSTIVTANGESIGQRNGLSAGDIAALRSIYKNLNWVNP